MNRAQPNAKKPRKTTVQRGYGVGHRKDRQRWKQGPASKALVGHYGPTQP